MARENIKLQKTFYHELPFVDKLFDGTINIQLAPKVYFCPRVDYSYWGVEWKPGCIEAFGMIKVLEIFHNGKSYKDYPGYLYFPSASPHVRKKNVLELWCEEIELDISKEIEIEIESGKLLLRDS